jgi:hypothetical protein
MCCPTDDVNEMPCLYDSSIPCSECERIPGDWYWRIRAKNGNIRADSGEGYARRIDALAFPEGLGFTKFCVVES